MSAALRRAGLMGAAGTRRRGLPVGTARAPSWPAGLPAATHPPGRPPHLPAWPATCSWTPPQSCPPCSCEFDRAGLGSLANNAIEFSCEVDQKAVPPVSVCGGRHAAACRLPRPRSRPYGAARRALLATCSLAPCARPAGRGPEHAPSHPTCRRPHAIPCAHPSPPPQSKCNWEELRSKLPGCAYEPVRRILTTWKPN